MSKTWLITPAFCRWELLLDCLMWIHKDGLPSGFTHVVIDNHYPVKKSLNRRCIQTAAHQHGATYIDSGRDLGLHEGINNAARVLGIKPEDVVVGCDPDDRPSPGFVETLSSVIRGDQTIAIAGASFSVIEQRNRDGIFREKRQVAGHEVWVHPRVEMWNVCAFNWRFVTEIGGLKQPNGYYGGLEACLYPEWAKRWMSLAYVPEVRSDVVSPDRNDPVLFDPEYAHWKAQHLSGYKGSFEEFLTQYYPARLL